MINSETNSTQEAQTSSSETIPWYVLNSPEIGKPFHDFCTACNTEGVLDRKTKELLKLSLAAVFHCPQYIASHIRNALKAGATKEEITETLLISAMECTGTQLEGAKENFLKYSGKKG